MVKHKRKPEYKTITLGQCARLFAIAYKHPAWEKDQIHDLVRSRGYALPGHIPAPKASGDYKDSSDYGEICAILAGSYEEWSGIEHDSERDTQ